MEKTKNGSGKRRQHARREKVILGLKGIQTSAKNGADKVKGRIQNGVISNGANQRHTPKKRSTFLGFVLVYSTAKRGGGGKHRLSCAYSPNQAKNPRNIATTDKIDANSVKIFPNSFIWAIRSVEYPISRSARMSGEQKSQQETRKTSKTLTFRGDKREIMIALCGSN